MPLDEFADMGLGGQLAAQVSGETDEERRRRLELLRNRQSFGALSLASRSLSGPGAAIQPIMNAIGGR